MDESNNTLGFTNRVKFFVDNSWQKIKVSLPLIFVFIFVSIVVFIAILLNKQNLEQRPEATPVPNTLPSPLPIVGNSGSQASIPHGIYAVVAMDKPNVQYNSSDIDALLGNPAISGIAFRPLWSDLEPSDNSFDFSKIDDVLSRLSSHGKTLQLIIVPGFYSPSWLVSQLPSCDPQPTAGCGKASFKIPYGPNAGKTADLPLPWNQTYKAAWQNFLSNLAKQYGNNNNFVSIAVAGPTSVSAEMSMPDDLTKWSKLLKFFYPNDSSYWDSDKAFVSEWQKMIDFYGQTFNNRAVVLTMGSGLPSFQKGDPTAAKLQIVNYFQSASLGTNLKAIQTSGLKACRNNESGVGLIKQLAGQTKNLPPSQQILGGAQFNSSATNHPDTMGCTGDCKSCKGQKISPNQAVLNVLGNYFDTTPFGPDFSSSQGQNPMDYLQVYEDDIFYANSHRDVQSTLSRASQDILKMNPKE